VLSDWGEDARVLLSSVTCTVSIPYDVFNAVDIADFDLNFDKSASDVDMFD